MTERRVFEKQLFAGWGDMDFNSHMRNTAFLDKSADVRMMFFAENGFPTSEFMRRSLGPVILRDELEYFKEVRLLEPLRVTLAIAGLSADGSRFSMRNEFWRPEGKLAARVNSFAGWLDLSARRLVLPPETLLVALRSLPETDDFQVLTTTTKSKPNDGGGG
jgi:acyl-CoA thioester hydrolase